MPADGDAEAPGQRPADDPYARVAYRRLVAWERRIEREAPFLLRLLAEAPDRSVLDVGCGTGEHVAFFADQGARAVGIDASPSMIEAARDYERQGRGRFVEGDARDGPRLLAGEPPFGLAICLGNMLPHLQEESELDGLLAAVHGVLRPGGHFLVQILNYVRIVDEGIRHLPLNFREDESGCELVFLRLMTPRADGRILFFPTTLEIDPDADEPVTLRQTRRVPLRAWTGEELEAACARAGFTTVRHGDLQGGAFDAHASVDLVLVARR